MRATACGDNHHSHTHCFVRRCRNKDLTLKEEGNIEAPAADSAAVGATSATHRPEAPVATVAPSTDSAAEKPDFTWPDGRKWKGQMTKDVKGQVTKDSRPIGYGTITDASGNSKQLTNCDSEGRDLNGKKFVKHGRSGYFKFFAMPGSNQGKYELQYMTDASGEPEYVSAADAYPLYAAGCEYEQQTKETHQQEAAAVRAAAPSAAAAAAMDTEDEEASAEEDEEAAAEDEEVEKADAANFDFDLGKCVGI